ncbi:hypothetical protein D3C71_848650 [compost metagenome]
MQRPSAHSPGVVASDNDWKSRPSHTPLQPDWLSRHSGAMPARFSTCSSDWCARIFFSSYSWRPHGENRHGSDTSVLVPQECMSGKLTTAAWASSGVVLRPPFKPQFCARTVSPITITSRRGLLVGARGVALASVPIGSFGARCTGLSPRNARGSPSSTLAGVAR